MALQSSFNCVAMKEWRHRVCHGCGTAVMPYRLCPLHTADDDADDYKVQIHKPGEYCSRLFVQQSPRH